MTWGWAIRIPQHRTRAGNNGIACKKSAGDVVLHGIPLPGERSREHPGLLSIIQEKNCLLQDLNPILRYGVSQTPTITIFS